MDGQGPAEISVRRRQPLSATLAGVWSRPLVPACLLLVLTVLAYLPALSAGFVFDDGVYVTQDARMASVDGLRRIWTEVGGPDYRHQYYPLTTSAFWVQYQLWGESPFGYHLVNILLHAVNAVLLWRLLGALRVPGALLGAAIFAVHPVHVQSVAWITELKNVLSTLLVLSSALVFVGWFGLGGGDAGASGTRRSRQGYAVGLLLFVGALASKTATCLLPAALALLLWWKRDRLGRRDLLPLLPLFALGLGFVALTVVLETHHRAHGAAFEQGWLERCLIAGRAAWFYAGKLAWPAGLVFIYPRWSVDVHAWWQYLHPAALVAVLLGLWRLRPRIGKGPVTAAAYFALAVVPMSFVNIAFTRLSYVSDHWQYWASMGLIALAAAVVAVGTGRLRQAPARGAAAGAALGAIALLAGLTWQRCHAYRDEQTLWTDTIARNPTAWAAHNNLALALQSAGRIGEAIDHFRMAVAINPGYAEGYNNLGLALLFHGRADEATVALRAALRLEPELPGPHFNLALIHRSQGRLDEAIRHYREVLRRAPRSVETLINLGEALAARGQTDDALRQYRRATELAPRSAEAHLGLGLTLLEAGRLDDAAAYLREAQRLDPGLGVPAPAVVLEQADG